jgi:hypothetical protein
MQTASYSVEEFVRQLPQSTRSIVEKLQDMVRSVYPSAKEIIYHDTLGYTPTGHPFDRIIYIWPCKEHVTLGFFYGTSLPDPKHLLVGVGKRMRHVKVKTVEEANSPALRKLVRAARKNATKSLKTIHKERTGE